MKALWLKCYLLTIIPLILITDQLWRVNETFYNFRVNNKQFIGLENQGQGNGLVAVSNTAGYSETFQIVRKDGDSSRVRLSASNGMFIQVLDLYVHES